MYKKFIDNFKNYIFTQLIVASLYYLVSLITPYTPVALEFTYIDLIIKPNAYAFWIYISFFFMLMAGVTFSSKENSIKCCKVILLNSAIASLFFIFMPTKITFWDYSPYIEQGTATHALMLMIKQHDASSNCLPSLHIANSIVACYFLIKDKKPYIQALSIIWLLAIIWSVLSTKQHYFYDVVGGAMVAAVSIAIILNSKLGNSVSDKKLGIDGA
jgi:membrane-associated phospholipid phosphatase